MDVCSAQWFKQSSSINNNSIGNDKHIPSNEVILIYFFNKTIKGSISDKTGRTWIMFGKIMFNFVVHMLRIRLDGASMTVPVNLFIGILKNCKF